MPQRIISSAGTYRRSLSFNGTNQYLSISDANYTSPNFDKFSISLWYYLSSDATRYLYAQGSGSTTDSFRVLLQSSKLEFQVSDGASATHGTLITTANFNTTSVWYHVLLHWDRLNATANDRMRMWINGTEISSFGTRNNPTNAMNNSTTAVTVGADSTGGQRWAGNIYQPLLASNILIPIGSVYGGGKPKVVTGLSNLHSLLDTNIRDSLVDDYILAANWTNNNTVAKSTIVP